MALLVARDEYYLRSALRGASSFDVRDARRSFRFDDLVRASGHLAAARVFRELVTDRQTDRQTGRQTDRQTY